MKSGWETKRLGNVCLFDKAQGVHKSLPYVGLEDIECHAARFIGSTQPQSMKSATFRFSSRHVLYGRLRPYLNKVLAPDFDGHCSTEIFPILPRPELSREYLLYWLLKDETVDQINATCTGARMPRANMNEVLAFDFPLAPLPEQQRIVGILDDAFGGLATAKANAEKNLKNARAIFESELNAIFTRKGDGWKEKPLLEVSEIKHGYAFEGEYFSNKGEFVLLTPGNFYERGGYRDRGDKQKYYTGTIPRDYVLNEDDLLIAMTEQAAGLLGSPILVPESGKFLHNQRLGLVTKKAGATWTNEFLFHIFNTQAVRRAIHENASGVKVRHTSPTKIGDVVVALPPSLSEQQRIVAKLDNVNAETQRLESIYQRKLEKLDALKKSLLHHAFTGQL